MVILITNNTFGDWYRSMQAEGATEDVNLHVHKGIESSCNINALILQSHRTHEQPHHGLALNLKLIFKPSRFWLKLKFSCLKRRHDFIYFLFCESWNSEIEKVHLFKFCKLNTNYVKRFDAKFLKISMLAQKKKKVSSLEEISFNKALEFKD